MMAERRREGNPARACWQSDSRKIENYMYQRSRIPSRGEKAIQQERALVTYPVCLLCLPPRPRPPQNISAKVEAVIARTAMEYVRLHSLEAILREVRLSQM